MEPCALSTRTAPPIPNHNRCAHGAALLAWIVAAVLVVMGSFCYGEVAVQVLSASGDAEYLSPC